MAEYIESLARQAAPSIDDLVRAARRLAEDDHGALLDAPDSMLYTARSVGQTADTGETAFGRAWKLPALRLWLITALQTAVRLEFSTIPPYLCALWSVKDELHPVAKSIREVVQEEMLHMALACNMLAAVGGRPDIKGMVPVYPGHLPGGVHPHLVVGLSGLTREVLAAFMEIERPAKIIDDQIPGDEPATVEGDDPTIGAFYDSIRDAFRALDAAGLVPYDTDRQVTGPLSWSVVGNLKDAEDAIETIKRQGEGSDASPVDTGPDDLAHFYRFQAVYAGHELIWDEDAGELKPGAPIEWPDVWPMAAVPKGGYDPDAVDPTVGHHLRMFDRTYGRLIDLLHETWGADGQAALVHAIATMFELQRHALPLMETPLPGGEGTYGPCFRVGG